MANTGFDVNLITPDKKIMEKLEERKNKHSAPNKIENIFQENKAAKEPKPIKTSKKLGRPKGTEARKLIVSAYLSKEEKETVKKEADKLEITSSVFMRNAILKEIGLRK